jgi:hypothetical protein
MNIMTYLRLRGIIRTSLARAHSIARLTVIASKMVTASIYKQKILYDLAY